MKASWRESGGRGLRNRRGPPKPPLPTDLPPPLALAPGHSPSFSEPVACSLADLHVEGCAPRGQDGGHPGGVGGGLRGRTVAAAARLGCGGRGRLADAGRGCTGPPAKARRPPPAGRGRGAPGAQCPPCGLRGTAASARLGRRGHARRRACWVSLPGEEARSAAFLRAKGGPRAAARRGRGGGGRRGGPGTHAHALLRSCDLRPPSVFPVPRAPSGRAQVLKARLRFPCPPGTAMAHTRERPGPETPSSGLETPLDRAWRPVIAGWEKRKRSVSE